MDLGFAAEDEADGDWGDDDVVDQQSDHQEPQPEESHPAAEKAPGSDAASGAIVPSEDPVQRSLLALAAPPQPDGPRPPPSKIHSNPRTRYFVIKSNNHKNLVLSVENNVWATQRHNEDKLNEALRSAPHVILVFSVNQSGCFQGYAKMIGAVGASQKTDVFRGYGRAFDIRWLRLDDLDFSLVSTITNPWNENKSVKVSRDGQELPNEVGQRLCEMIDLRVYQSDPGGYAADENEVETNGTMPPPRSATDSFTATGVGAPPLAPAPPMPQPGLSPAAAWSAWTVSYGGLPVPLAGTPPPPPPFSPPPSGTHGAMAPPWAYPPWMVRVADDVYSYSSYYSYSDYSASESEQAAPPPPLPKPAKRRAAAPDGAASAAAGSVGAVQAPQEAPRPGSKEKKRHRHEAKNGHHVQPAPEAKSPQHKKQKKSDKVKPEKSRKEAKDTAKSKSGAPKEKKTHKKAKKAGSDLKEPSQEKRSHRTSKRKQEEHNNAEEKSQGVRHRKHRSSHRRREGRCESRSRRAAARADDRVGSSRPQVPAIPPGTWTPAGPPLHWQGACPGVSHSDRQAVSASRVAAPVVVDQWQ